jgi:periplasmic divalent cation tolerance protein
MSDAQRLLQIVTTVPDDDQARRLARLMVSRRMAACVQITGPIFSVYPWQGKIEQSEEWRLLIKTQARMFGPICAFLRDNHPYELPQVVALPIEDASPEYAQWVAQQLAPPDSP